MRKVKKITIIGDGLAAWSFANAIVLNKNFEINIIGKKRKIIGAQQLSPTGIQSYIDLTGNNRILNEIHNFRFLKINKLKEDKVKNLVNYKFLNSEKNYGSISRNFIINDLKNNIMEYENFSFIDDEVIKLRKNKNNLIEILTLHDKILSADLVIGADGYNGISRSYVCGIQNLNLKKIYRSTSNQNIKIILSRNTLQIFFTEQGHLVAYPFKHDKKELVNFIFVPNRRNQNNFSLENLKYNHPLLESLEWNLINIPIDTDSKTVFFRDNLLLFGNSALNIEPHLAQAGNQIFEDALFVKNNFNFLNINDFVDNYIKKRLNKKRVTKSNSYLSGKILGLNGILSIPRDFLISNFSKRVFDNVFKN